jgi:hypothetical protein
LPKQKPEILWTLDTVAPVALSPSVTAEGLVVIGSHGNKVWALLRAARGLHAT